MILRKYKNAFLPIIKESGIDPKLFSARDGTINKEKFFILQLLNSPLQFAIRPYRQSFDYFESVCSQFSYGYPLGQGHISYSFEDLSADFIKWLHIVVEPYLDEANTPDLWQTLQETSSDTLRELESPDYSESFSEEEKIQLRLSIEEFHISIVNNLNPPKEYQNTIDSHFKDLSDAIDKQNKFAFKLMAIQLVIAITIDLALNPEQFNQLLQLLKNVFSQISYLLP